MLPDFGSLNFLYIYLVRGTKHLLCVYNGAYFRVSDSSKQLFAKHNITYWYTEVIYFTIQEFRGLSSPPFHSLSITELTARLISLPFAQEGRLKVVISVNFSKMVGSFEVWRNSLGKKGKAKTQRYYESYGWVHNICLWFSLSVWCYGSFSIFYTSCFKSNHL